MKMARIAIIGLGLIGGSLGLALKNALGSKVTITGVDRCSSSLAEAKQVGAVDIISADDQVLANQDIVFVCTPVLQIGLVMQQILPYLTAGTIITDVGSTKHFLLEQLKDILPAGLSYIGGHPMAGREKSGITAADKNLFANKWYILSQGIHASPEHYQILSELIRATGAKVIAMNAAEHDCGAAYMSHIPHVAAAALVNLLINRSHQENLLKLMGGGFKDTTRIASSDADMWSDICLTNSIAMIDGLKEYQNILEAVIGAIEGADRAKLYAFFSSAKEKRDSMLEQEA